MFDLYLNWWELYLRIELGSILLVQLDNNAQTDQHILLIVNLQQV